MIVPHHGVRRTIKSCAPDWWPLPEGLEGNRQQPENDDFMNHKILLALGENHSRLRGARNCANEAQANRYPVSSYELAEDPSKKCVWRGSIWPRSTRS